jgi:hypothetical protein
MGGATGGAGSRRWTTVMALAGCLQTTGHRDDRPAYLGLVRCS